MVFLRLCVCLFGLLIAAQVSALELIVQVTPLPPYVLEGTRHGIACDIIERALASQGVKTRFVFSNNKRMESEVEAGTADAGFAGISINNKRIFFSDAVIDFENIAVTLRNQGLRIYHINDLENKKIIAFRNARRIMGSEFALVTERNPFYFEAGEQRSQLPMLDAGRGELVVMEKRAFLFFSQALHGKEDAQLRYTIHPVFKPVSRVLGFHFIEYRNIFNKGLKLIRANGEYAAIVSSYIGE